MRKLYALRQASFSSNMSCSMLVYRPKCRKFKSSSNFKLSELQENLLRFWSWDNRVYIALRYEFLSNVIQVFTPRLRFINFSIHYTL